jgi:hypothetical protein
MLSFPDATYEENHAAVLRMADANDALAPITLDTPIGTPIVALFGGRDAAGEYIVGTLTNVVMIDGALCADGTFTDRDGAPWARGGTATAFRVFVEVATYNRYYVISEKHGLVAVTHDPERAEELSLIAAVNTARTVYLHDRLTELAVNFNDADAPAYAMPADVVTELDALADDILGAGF